MRGENPRPTILRIIERMILTTVIHSEFLGVSPRVILYRFIRLSRNRGSKGLLGEWMYGTHGTEMGLVPW